MTVFFIILLVLALLLAMPVGVLADFRDQVTVRIQVGFLRFTVYPEKKKGKPKGEKKQKKPEKASKAKEESREEKPGPTPRQILYSIEKLLPVVFRALGRVGRRLRIDPLEVHAVFAGEDPADVAILYGRCQALTAALLPLVEETVTVRHRDIRLETDFQGERTAISGRVGARLRVWDGLVLLGTLAAGGISWLRGYRRLGRASPTDGKQTDTAAAAS